MSVFADSDSTHDPLQVMHDYNLQNDPDLDVSVSTDDDLLQFLKRERNTKWGVQLRTKIEADGHSIASSGCSSCSWNNSPTDTFASDASNNSSFTSPTSTTGSYTHHNAANEVEYGHEGKGK